MAEKGWSTGKKVGIILLCIFLLIFFSGGCFTVGLISGSFGRVLAYPAVTGEAIYQINVDGIISGTKYYSIFGETSVTPEEIIEQLKQAEQFPNVKAILIRINSPGGSAAASQEIYEELKRVEKPIVVSVSDICASGAYYVSSAADKILANRSSAVGSIGVIMRIANLEELYDKLGIKYTTIKKGKYKDVGSPDRPLTHEERKLLEEQTQKIYEQFIHDVADSRGMDIKTVEELATGWVFTGSEAVENGLIDGIGTYNDAIRAAAELGGIEVEPEIIRKQPPTLWDMLFSYYMGSFLNKVKGAQHYYPVFE